MPRSRLLNQQDLLQIQATKIFDLQKGFEKGLTIQIYSFLGKKMYESPGLTLKQSIDLSDFNRGIYMYHLVDATGKVVKSGKFQVSK